MNWERVEKELYALRREAVARRQQQAHDDYVIAQLEKQLAREGNQ